MAEMIIENGWIFDFVYGMAVNDALNQSFENTTGDKVALLNNSDVKNYVLRYCNEILAGKAPDIIEYGRNIQKADGTKPKSFTFGKIQKLINMTMKYMYIRYYNTGMENRFVDCDAPMDSVMMDLIYYYKKSNDACRFKKLQTWSSIDYEEIEDYKRFQEAVRSIIGPELSKIEFDYAVWDKAKELKKIPLKERPQMAKEIIDEYLNTINK